MGNKKKYEHKTIGGQYIALPRAFTNSEAFANLSPFALKLFFELLAQYNHYNNGDLSCPWSRLVKRGWKSRDSYDKALKELLDKKFIIKTRQGGRNKCNLFALTLYCLDDCNGKLNAGFKATSSPIGGWNRKDNGYI